MYDLIIIGGGPAGLAAATFAHNKDLSVRLIAEQLGGWNGAHQRLTAEGADTPLGGEAAVRLLASEVSATRMLLHDHVTGLLHRHGVFGVTTRTHGLLEAVSVIVTTGARPVMLDVPGAAEFVGQGLAYSATTHSHVLRGKTVAVIGSTERALRGVIELALLGSEVYLIVDDLDSIESPLTTGVRQLPNVVLMEGWQVREISGGMSAEAVVITREDMQRNLAIDAAFVDLGLVANSELVQGLAQTDRDGFIKVDERRATSLPGLFAAGDVTTMLCEQKLVALGEGARAAWSAFGYVLAHRAVARTVATPT